MQNWLQKLQSRKFLLAIGTIIGIWAGPQAAETAQSWIVLLGQIFGTALTAGLYAIGEGIADGQKKA